MEFRALGPLEVVEDGRPVPLDRQRLRALLAFLLLHANEAVSTDRLIDEVWGPDPPKTASASLQNYVSRLRKAIGADTLVSQPPGYVLRVDPEQFDLARFERLTGEARGAEAPERAEKLRAALALWRGPALDDLAFEPFARDEVGRLEEARLAALEDCIDAELELGRGGDLVGELEALVEQHPLRERFRAQLMRALYRAGRQADALAAFQDAREVLTEELGLEPGEELRSLQQAILRHDPSLGASAQAPIERGPDRRTVTAVFCDLVGSTELAAQMDPEAYRALLSRYFELVREPIERHGGMLEKFIGDAVLAVFGVAELHEDDALRAVRAAIDAQAALRDAGIAARIGVSTGEVHVLSSPGEPLHVSGATPSAAAQLEGRAPSGGVLLDNETYLLVRDALRAEEKDGAWLAVEVVPGAPGYARRLDAPLVGRADELARLHAAYVAVRDGGHSRVTTIVGEAGIGKTRLMRELLLPLREEARILVGRCVSYGEGATYLPIAEAIRQAAATPAGIAALVEGEDDAEQVTQRIAELAGLAEGPAAPGEAFWAVRRFVEGVARDRPLVLVLDDIHWAEPTLLDLIEYLGEWVRGRVLVLCAARRELIERRSSWSGPTSTGFVVELAPLAGDEVSELLASLSEEAVAPDVERRIVEQAGGNPLFAEQLLALAQEMPDFDLGAAPPTVEALLASRLDQLDPHELAVLRRASVIGRRFTRAELADLTPREEARRTERDLADLAARALVHPREHVFAFHHVLVRDVAYRSIPKSERADLHELAARGFARRDAPDEIVGFHYEQANQYVTELSLRDGRANELAVAGGEPLGRAGIRAWQRADVHAAENLLRRALALMPDAHDIACELGLALNVLGERSEAMDVFRGVIERADGHHKLRAETELAVLQSLGEPNYARTVLETCARAIPVHEAAGDDRALGRAWFGIAHVRGSFFCEYAAMEEAGERIAACYSRAGWPLATAVQVLGTALQLGPTPVAEGIARLSDLAAQDTSRWIDANVSLLLGRLEAMRANFDTARAELERARTGFTELRLSAALGDMCKSAAAAVEFAADDLESAAALLREACEFLERQGEIQVLATRAAELANVLYAAGQYGEATHWIRTARDRAGGDDLDAALTRQPVEAMLRAREGHLDEAERLARAAVELAAATDSPNRRAEALVALAEVLALAGATVISKQQVDVALALYEQKGNTAAAARVRARYEEPRAGLLVPDADAP